MNTNIESDEETSVLHNDDKWGQIGMKPAVFLKHVVVFGHSYEEQKSWHVMNIVLWGKGVCIVLHKIFELRWNICSDKIPNKFRKNTPYFADNTFTKKHVREIWQKEVRDKNDDKISAQILMTQPKFPFSQKPPLKKSRDPNYD